jgi:Flp pilus assembly protein TadG
MMKRRSRERGQDLVEFALVLPILLFTLMIILDLGRAVYYYSAIHNSAREGARYGIIYPDDPAGIEAAARDTAIGLDPIAMTVTINFPDDEHIQVVATFQFTAVTPFVGVLLGTNEITLDTSSTMRIEG